MWKVDVAEVYVRERTRGKHAAVQILHLISDGSVENSVNVVAVFEEGIVISFV